ncbi:MAG TPA: hypothetical protein VHK69_02125 [Chitinophagaceae bacterium]|jgi:hypothetical protein|nr:hypothetical protein [Chitinophagaceae bacterium]
MIQNANDRPTYMTDLQKCLNKLEAEGYNDQYKMQGESLYNLSCGVNYKPEDLIAVNFYRFEGPSNPDDMSILYAIETTDGRKGTIIDAYGLYADENLGAFMQAVEIHKKTKDKQLY